jgi:hypothetical protein
MLSSVQHRRILCLSSRTALPRPPQGRSERPRTPPANMTRRLPSVTSWCGVLCASGFSGLERTRALPCHRLLLSMSSPTCDVQLTVQLPAAGPDRVRTYTAVSSYAADPIRVARIIPVRVLVHRLRPAWMGELKERSAPGLTRQQA